jgi:hypothetical protein
MPQPGIKMESAATQGRTVPLRQPCLDSAAHDDDPPTRRQRVTASFLVYLDVDIDPVDSEGRWRGHDSREPLAEDIADELREHLAYQAPEPGDLVQEIHRVSAAPAATITRLREVLDRIRCHREELLTIHQSVETAETSGNITQTERAIDARERHYIAESDLLHDLLTALAEVGIR